MARDDFLLNGLTVNPGQRRILEIPIGRMADHTPMSVTAEVIHGRAPGPVVFISAAIHGDEILGVEVIRRISSLGLLRKVRGTLILVPIVNSYGFIGLSRYLPDRRDLNRVFPGSANGSLASQLAHTFMTQIVAQSEYGIDLHTAAIHRENLPQIRADLDDSEVLSIAQAFHAPIMLNANLRDGSLRAAAKDVGCKILLFEAGEALRFDESAIRVGVKGILGVLRQLGMLKGSTTNNSRYEPLRSNSSHWLRAPIGGVMRSKKGLGDRVKKGETIALVAHPLGAEEQPVLARQSGIVIGRTNLPIVHRGDALFHVAGVASLADAEDSFDELDRDLENDPLFDGMEIV